MELVPDTGEASQAFARTMRSVIFASFTFGAERAGQMIGLPEGQGITSGGESKLRVNDEAFVREMNRLSAKIVDTSAATQKAVTEHLIVGRERGYTITQIIDGVPKDKFAGLAESFPFSRARAKRIAATEITSAENVAAVTAWRESGVVDEVEILDGDGCGWTSHDDGDLANGSIRSMDEAIETPMAHPHCVRVPVPVVKGASNPPVDLEADRLIDEARRRFPIHKTNTLVDGRRVINADNIPNLSSIDASVVEPFALEGIRVVRMDEFRPGLTGRHYSVQGTRRIKELAAQIRASNEITPLIIVYDPAGPYILEGATRAEALEILKASEFPAHVIVDLADVPIAPPSS